MEARIWPFAPQMPRVLMPFTRQRLPLVGVIGSRLAAIKPETEFVCFFVRPESFKIFQQARALAWLRNINVSCELLDEKDPIMIGPGGDRILPQ